MKYFLLSGFKGSGKDTFADMVLSELHDHGVDAKKYSLAGKLKSACCHFAGLPIDYAYDEFLKEKVLDKPIHFSMMELEYVLTQFEVELPLELKETLIVPEGFSTMRRALQYVGTDVLRHASASIHCEVTEKQIKREGTALAIISDCRFFNEAEYFQAPTFFVHRKAKMPENTPDLHRSEKEMFELMAELPTIDNNSSLDDLRKKAKRQALILIKSLK